MLVEGEHVNRAREARARNARARVQTHGEPFVTSRVRGAICFVRRNSKQVTRAFAGHFSLEKRRAQKTRARAQGLHEEKAERRFHEDLGCEEATFKKVIT